MQRFRMFGMAACVTLTSCAMSPAQQAQLSATRERFIATRPHCDGQRQCEAVWAAARNWVTSNCVMRIQTMTDSFIETYNAPEGETGLACRVTKDPEPSGGYVINITTGCGNLFGCAPDAWAAALNFNEVVAAQAAAFAAH